MNPPLRLLFAGTPDFAAAALAALLASRHSVVGVYTQPDRPAGRGRKLTPSPVKQLALEHGLPVEQPERLRDPADQARLAAYHTDVMVVAAYGLLLPQAVLDAPRLGCLNIHASLLPRWRGAAPIQRAILAGDRESGITIMQMDAGLDTGAMLLRRPCPIRPDETAATLHDRLAHLGAEAIVEALDALEGDQLTPTPQDPALATYAHKLEKAEGRIDWQQSATQIDRQVRALDPWPVAFSDLDGEPLRLFASRLTGRPATAAPGTIVSAGRDGLEIATGENTLLIGEVQPAGKRRMAAADFAHARPLPGRCLGQEHP